MPLDFELLQAAFEDRDGDGAWFLDRATGEVIRLTDDDIELPEEIESSDRYIAIPYQGSEPGYRDMVDFIMSVEDHRLRALLDVAINGQHAFRRFKDVLRDHARERDRWFAFAKERAEHRIRRWLASEGIEVR
jgi:uncharacterized protein UPF0158